MEAALGIPLTSAPVPLPTAANIVRRSIAVAMIALGACRGGSTGPQAEPASIVLSPTSVTFSSLDESRDLVATVLDDGGSAIPGVTVAWETSASPVATVSSQGRVVAVGNGTAEITASVGAIEASATVTVQQVPVSLTLSPDTLRLASVGDTARVSETVRDAGGSTVVGAAVTFSAADPSVATVDATGLVSAQGDGGTTITGQVPPGGGSLTESVRVEVGLYLPPAYLVGGYMGVDYSDQIGPASGIQAPTYTVTGGALPPGLALDPPSAQITGTPTTPGVYFFEVSASSGLITASERFAITISTQAAGAFNLWIAYNGGQLPPTNAKSAVSAAVAHWEQVVTGDAGSAVTYPPSGLGPGDCSLVDASLLNGAFVEDAAILMSIDAIDGPSKTLARGGPCGYGRTSLPAVITGQLQLDEADVAIANASYLEEIVWHEIAHALGFGTLWQDSTTGIGTPNPLYVGEHAKEEWLALGGAPGGVPLEPDIGAHWDEAWFDAELMTPFSEAPTVAMPISRVTIGALLDLGWAASLIAADPYALPPCAGSCTTPSASEGSLDVSRVPDFVVDPLLPLPPESER